MNKNETHYSWEDRVNAIVNNIIITLYREYNPNKISELENLVKKHLESR